MYDYDQYGQEYYDTKEEDNNDDLPLIVVSKSYRNKKRLSANERMPYGNQNNNDCENFT